MRKLSKTWILVLAVALAAAMAGYFFLVPSGNEAGQASAGRKIDEDAIVENAGTAVTSKSHYFQTGMKSERDRATGLEKLDTSTVSERVQMVVGMAAEKSYKARMDAVHALGRNLSNDEVNALMEFLADRGDNLPTSQINAVKNDIVEKLLRQETMPPGLGTRLAEMYLEKDRDPVWRDYCIQLVSLYYERRWEPGSEDDSDEREMIRNTLWHAVSADVDSGIAGTALLSLKRLSEHYPEFGGESLLEACIGVLSRPDSHPSAKTCALQTASSLGDKRVLETARRTAETADIIPLRMAAIAALGRIGELDEIQLLENIGAGNAGRYTYNAAETAIWKIMSRE